MRTILSLAVGFWLGRQIYINYDKSQALQKEARIKKKVTSLLERNGVPFREIKEEIQAIGI